MDGCAPVGIPQFAMAKVGIPSKFWHVSLKTHQIVGLHLYCHEDVVPNISR
jgi:hypothetical protein